MTDINTDIPIWEQPWNKGHVHGDWDAGGHCNKLLLDEPDGCGETCGYVSLSIIAPADRNPITKPRLFGDIIGYTAEISEPNGPRIVGYVLSNWADRAQARFEKWLGIYAEGFEARLNALEANRDHYKAVAKIDHTRVERAEIELLSLRGELQAAILTKNTMFKQKEMQIERTQEIQTRWEKLEDQQAKLTNERDFWKDRAEAAESTLMAVIDDRGIINNDLIKSIMDRNKTKEVS